MSGVCTDLAWKLQLVEWVELLHMLEALFKVWAPSFPPPLPSCPPSPTWSHAQVIYVTPKGVLPPTLCHASATLESA